MLLRGRLALRNLARHGRRTFFALCVIGSGVASIILAGGFVQDIFRVLAESIVRSQTGHLQIAKAGYFEAGLRSPEKFLIDDVSALSAELAAGEEVSAVASRIHFPGSLSNGRTDHAVLVEGVEPGKEAGTSDFNKIKAGRFLQETDRFAATVGEGVGQALRLGAGDNAVLMARTAAGAINTIDLEVIGVTQSFSREFDARTAKLSLAAAQDLFDTRGANVVVVTLKRTEDTDRVAGRLAPRVAEAGLELRTWSDLSDFYRKAVDLYTRQFGVLQLVVVLMVLLGVANVMNTIMFERTFEFGTMRALGNRRRDVIALILAEAAALGLAGATSGVLLGWLCAAAVSAIGIPMPPVPNSNLGYVARIVFDPGVASSAFAVGVIASVAAAVPSAARISALPIVDALRRAD